MKLRIYKHIFPLKRFKLSYVYAYGFLTGFQLRFQLQLRGSLVISYTDQHSIDMSLLIYIH